jgi:hypothetical protein
MTTKGARAKVTATTCGDLFVPSLANYPNDEDLSSGTPVSGKDGAPPFS